MSAPSVTRLDRLEIDVDSRIVDLWKLADVCETWDVGRVGEFMRSAYVAGYMEAAQGDRSLFTDNGYAVPVAR